MTEEKLEDTELYKKVKAYNEKWEREKELREKEIEERKEKSIFEDSQIKDHDPIAQLTKGEVHPSIAKDPDFPSLTILQRQQIESFLINGLSIRSTVKACRVAFNFSPSYGTVQQVRKKMVQLASKSD
jgi:hypothetical protein